jgi:uncharacterized protein YkwD
MRSHRSARWTGRARLVPALFVLTLLACACGETQANLEAARGHLRRGDLARAEAAIAEETSASAATLRRQIAESREQREQIERELARLALLDPWSESEGLERLLEGTGDPLLIEEIDRALSRAVDRAAAEASRERIALRSATGERIARTARQRSEEAPVVPPARDLEPAPEHAQGTTPDTSVGLTEWPELEVTGPAPGDAVQPIPGAPEPPAGEAVGSDPDSELALRAPLSEAESQPQPPSQPETDPLGPELVRAETRLLKAGASQRDEAWLALVELGQPAEAHLARALEQRWDAGVRAVLKSPSLKMLEKLAQDRTELDFRRQQTLELIFDEEEYFYPYRPPECPPEQARKYWPVQRRVDELVAALRELWEVPRMVKLSSSFRENLEELSWCRARSAEVGLAPALPAELPGWVLLAPPEAKSLDLHEFCWTEGEARQLASDRAVLAYNQVRWDKKSQKDFGEEELAGAEEQLQVQITNEYRRMFGRRALAWNRRLQAAAHGHSSYMAKTGNFGHYEDGDEARKSPFDRMRLVGYNYGVSENCHMGGGSPQGAHEGWCKSSGHHRNILMPGHTEMASAVDGRYWTQNYGTDKEFQSEIDTWQD